MSLKSIVRFSCIAVFAVFMAFAFADDKDKGAKMKFEATSHDFGTVAQGETLKYAFKFTNVGTDTLRIGQVKTSCGCTAAWESSKVIAPKEEGQIEVSFGTASRQGPFTKSVYVHSNDVENPKRSVVIRGKIEVKKTEEKKTEEKN